MVTINKTIISFLIILAFLAAGFFLLNRSSQDSPIITTEQVNLAPEAENTVPEGTQYVKIAGQKIKVDLALTPAQQNQGLSGRSALLENEGMLFVFDTPGKYSFWMKDMNFPIDMIWIQGENTADLKIVYIKKNARPELYPETYGPDREANYVLEVVSGFAEKNNLQVGDSVEFTD